MGAAKLDINVEQGATFEIVLTIKDSQNAGVDLTNWTFSGALRETLASPNASASFTFTKSNQTTSPGEITVSIPATTTAAISCNTRALSGERPSTIYYYDIEALKSDGKTDRILEGRALVSPEATR